MVDEGEEIFERTSIRIGLLEDLRDVEKGHCGLISENLTCLEIEIFSRGILMTIVLMLSITFQENSFRNWRRELSTFTMKKEHIN